MRPRWACSPSPVGFIDLWAPSAWGYAETIVLFAAVIIGGAGSHRGAVLGAILVPVGFEEATRYIPQFGPPGLVDDLQWVAIGLLIVIFLWFRPQGVLPERRRRIGAGASSQPMNIPNEDVVTLDGVGRAPGLAAAVGPDGSGGRTAGRPITRSAPSSVEPDHGVVLRTMADTPARLSASQEFTESFFGAVPQTPKLASSVLTGGGADPAAEHPVHMTLVGEAALVGHLSQWDARPPQQRLGPGDAFVHHVGMRRRAGRLLEPPGELEAAQIHEAGQIADAEVVLQVLLFRRMLDRTGSPRGCG